MMVSIQLYKPALMIYLRSCYTIHYDKPVAMFQYISIPQKQRKQYEPYVPSWHGPDSTTVVVIVGDRAIWTQILLQTYFCLLGNQHYTVPA